MLMKLYARFGIDDFTDFNTLNSDDYPVMSDLYELIEKEFMAFDNEKKHLYTEEMLQNICLGLHSMCKGAESKYFNGHTNIGDGEFICFGVKGLMDTNKRLKDTLLFNILSYMSNQLLGRGNTVAAVDELYLFLTNMTAIEYIRNGMKRVRKRSPRLFWQVRILRTSCCLKLRSLPSRCSVFRATIFCLTPAISRRLLLLILCSLKNRSTA